MTLRMVVMGVSGCGKTSVGEGVAKRLGMPYRDGDDLHPAANVAKMAAGTQLTDEDRWPWLDKVGKVLAKDAPIVVGCSALKRCYRDRIRAEAGGAVIFVYLEGSRDLISGRMAKRTGHYMPLSLLESQFAALEVPGPDEAITVSIDQPLYATIADIFSKISM